jgi:hypothetical protein
LKQPQVRQHKTPNKVGLIATAGISEKTRGMPTAAKDIGNSRIAVTRVPAMAWMPAKPRRPSAKGLQTTREKVATSGTLTLASMPLPHLGAVLNNRLGY